MNRRYIEVAGVKLSYLEKNPGSTATLFFLHGNSNSSYLWHRQYQDEIFHQYRLIVFDLPGHGLSEKIQSGDYSVLNMGLLMAEAVKALAEGKPYGLVGLSLGANIVSEMLAWNVVPKGLVFLSAGLVGEGITPNDVVQTELVVEVLFSESPSRDSVKRYFENLPYEADANFSKVLLNQYDQTDPGFRRDFFYTVIQGQYSDELSLIWKWHGQPFVAYGAEDDVVSPHLLDRIELPYWRGKILRIEKSAHLLNFDRPDVLNPLICTYFNECFQR